MEITLDSPFRPAGTLPLYTVYCYDGGLYQVAGKTEAGLVQSYRVADYQGYGSLARVGLDPVVCLPDMIVEERKQDGSRLELYGLDCWGWCIKVAASSEDDARTRAIAAAGDADSLYAEMAEMANVRLLDEVPAASHVHAL